MIPRLLYPAFVALGAIVSYEDWRVRKIRNRWIAAGLVLGVLALAYLAVNSALGYGGIHGRFVADYYMPWGYYGEVGEHALLSVGASLALWRVGVWPAGDAKLFIVFALLLPLIDPRLPGFPRLLFLVMLINVFIPAGAAWSLETILGLARQTPRLVGLDWSVESKAVADRALKRVADHWPHRYSLLALSINLFCFFTAFRLLQRVLIGAATGLAARFLVFVALAAAWGRVAAVLRNRALGAATLCGLSVAAIAGAARGVDVSVWAWRGVTMMVNFGMFVSFGRLALAAVAERQSLSELTLAQVQAGAIVSEETWRELKRQPELRALGDRYSDGLSALEAEALRRWMSGGGGAAVRGRFYRAVPFAAWIFAGALLTFRFRATVLHAMLAAGARL